MHIEFILIAVAPIRLRWKMMKKYNSLGANKRGKRREKQIFSALASFNYTQIISTPVYYPMRDIVTFISTFSYIFVHFVDWVYVDSFELSKTVKMVRNDRNLAASKKNLPLIFNRFWFDGKPQQKITVYWKKESHSKEMRKNRSNNVPSRLD